MWTLKYLPQSQRDLLGLDMSAIIQVLKKLEQISQKEDPHLEKLEGFEYHKIRAGDYRAIVILDYKNKLIEVRRIGHRKNIYKKLN